MDSKITQKEYDDFKSLFQNTPSLALLHIQNRCDIVSSCLEDIKIQNDGTIIKKDLENIDCDRFRLKSREFEFIILSDIINSCSAKELLLKSCYHSLENSAYIIIIEDKKHNNTQEILQLLENIEYRVSNDIDIFNNYNLIMAKKLHMWGNGL